MWQCCTVHLVWGVCLVFIRCVLCLFQWSPLSSSFRRVSSFLLLLSVLLLMKQFSVTPLLLTYLYSRYMTYNPFLVTKHLPHEKFLCHWSSMLLFFTSVSAVSQNNTELTTVVPKVLHLWELLTLRTFWAVKSCVRALPRKKVLNTPWISSNME